MSAEMFFKWAYERHCKRAYLSDPIDPELIQTIIAAAGQAASSKNTQPWHVVGVSGPALKTFSNELCCLFDQDSREEPDYDYMIHPMPPQFKDRARACGYGLFDLKNIQRDDRDKRRSHNRENFSFFGAPLALFFFLPPKAERGNFLDLGLFMQTIMLGLVAHGLGSCPQASLMTYSQTIKKRLNIDPNWTFVCALSIGVPDPDNLVNTYVPERLPVHDYLDWL